MTLTHGMQIRLPLTLDTEVSGKVGVGRFGQLVEHPKDEALEGTLCWAASHAVARLPPILLKLRRPERRAVPQQVRRATGRGRYHGLTGRIPGQAGICWLTGAYVFDHPAPGLPQNSWRVVTS